MRGIGKVAAVLCLIGFSSWAGAQQIPLQNIDQSDFKNVVSDFGANSMHTSVSGASSLGHLYGFEIGLVGGQTNTPHINHLAHETDPSASASKLPHGEILGVVSVPFGITVEGGLIPKVGGEDFKFNSLALAVKWTPTEILLDWPVAVALKAQLAKSHLDFHQTISSVPTDFKYDNTLSGLTVLVSKDFMLVEPYAGFGLLSTKGDLNVSGSGSVFDPSFTTSQSASATRSGSVWMVGAELKLIVFKVGAEYANLFGTDRFSGKLSFYF
jgi:hypothetical protein